MHPLFWKDDSSFSPLLDEALGDPKDKKVGVAKMENSVKLGKQQTRRATALQ
jgi:hypothetical protein